MPTTAISPGPLLNISQGVVYALPASPCIITSGAVVQKSASFGGTYSDWVGSTGGIYHGGSTVQSHVKCLTGNTTIQAAKVKMTGPFSKGSYSESVAKSGPSNYWMLNETSGLIARDSIGGVNGTISGGVTLNQTGVGGGKCMVFNGVNGKIALDIFNFIVPNTFEVWFKTPLSSSPPPPIFSGYGANTILIGSYPNLLQVWVNGTFCRMPLLITDDNQWHHFICVMSGGTAIQGYLDGVAYPITPSLPVGFVGSPVSGEIGYTTSWGPILSWNGSLQDVAIYPRALTPSEILSHYQSR